MLKKSIILNYKTDFPDLYFMEPFSLAFYKTEYFTTENKGYSSFILSVYKKITTVILTVRMIILPSLYREGIYNSVSKLLPNCYLYIPTSTVRKMNGSARILWKTEPLLQNFLGDVLYINLAEFSIV